MRRLLLTKSKFLIGLQCPKYIWTVMNDPAKVPEPDRETKHKFTEGYLIDDLAKKQFPSGISITTDDFIKNIQESKKNLSTGKPLFEAGFIANNLFARADILTPAGNNAWDLIEIKSSTGVKEVHIYDVAFQKTCYEEAGLKVKRCYLFHVNKNYIKEGAIDPVQLLKKKDITQQVEQNKKNIKKRIKHIFTAIETRVCPDIDIGIRCSTPYSCPLIENCWSFLPEDNVFSLYYGGRKSWNLYKAGIYEIKDIPNTIQLTDKQKIQRECKISGKIHIDKQEIKNYLSSLIYPLYFLDFETFSTVIPLFDNIRPYQNVPFQFSLHKLNSLGENPEHHSFLSSDNSDPRKDFIAALQKKIGKTGSIVVYNQSFEKNILEQLATAFPEYSVWITQIIDRFSDLLVPFRAFQYYNTVQSGSASLKSVLPAVTGKGYKSLAIADGITASLEFLYITFGEIYGQKISEEKKMKTRQNLEKYCSLDTEGMIWIVRELNRMTAD